MLAHCHSSDYVISIYPVFFSAHLTCYMSKVFMSLQKMAYLCQVCPFVTPHGKTQLLLDIFSLVLYFGGVLKSIDKTEVFL